MNKELKNYWDINVDKKTHKIISKKTPEELHFLFAHNLKFGTGGARGIMDMGANAFNIFTLRNLVISYLEFLKTKMPIFKLKNRGIVIYHDNRNNSASFALEAAAYLTTNNIKVFIADNNDMKTTPFLSYSIKALKAIGGINITASHNSKEYNGFKCYNEFGGQLLPSECAKIEKIIDKPRPEIFFIKPTIYPKLLFEIPEILETGYIELSKIIQHNLLLPRKIKIVFSPQHGTTHSIIPKILHESGYYIKSFPEFSNPDPEFTGIQYINPENKKSFIPLIPFGIKEDADVIFMSDPDGDRFAVAIRNNDTYKVLHGNEIAILLVHYHIKFVKKRQKLKFQGYTISTHVSSPMVRLISEKNELKHFVVSTGFKWISDKIMHIQKEHPDWMFVFGFEEAIGYLPSNLTSEKDSIQSSILFADMMNYYKNNKLSIFDVLNNIYKEYGYMHHETFNFILEKEEKKQRAIESLLSVNIGEIAGEPIIYKEVISSKEEPNPTIIFYFNNEKTSFFAVRSSGTEPKIKVYCCIHNTETIAKNICSSIEKLFKKELS